MAAILPRPIALALLVSSALAAADSRGPVLTPGEGETVAPEQRPPVLAMDPRPRHAGSIFTDNEHWSPMAAIRGGGPTKLSMSLGALIVRDSAGGYMTAYEEGPIIQIEAGLGGGQLHVGYGARGVIIIFPVGLFAKASLLRTWGDPAGVEPNQTYLGASLEGTCFGLNLQGSLYGHIAGDDRDDDLLAAISIGVGF